MNFQCCTPDNYINFLVASPGPASCTEAARVQPCSPFAPAHDSFNRLLNRLEPDPEELWREAEPLVEKARGALILDDSTLDKRRSKHIGLVTRHWSGKHRKVIRGINLISLVWTDGDRKIPVDYRLFSKVDGQSKHDHFWDLLLTAKAREFSPKDVLFDSWYASLENLKQVRGHGWHWLTRLRSDRVVSGDDHRARPLGEMSVSASGTALHLRGYGMVNVFRIDAPDGDTELTNGLSLHPTKTKVVDARTDGFDFLGYHFRGTKHWPREKSITKLKDTIRVKTKRTNGDSLGTIIGSLNRTLRGWFVYFQHSRPWIFHVLDGWIRGRLRSILRKREKRRGRGRGMDHRRWPNAFFAEHGLFSLGAAHALACQSSPR